MVNVTTLVAFAFTVASVNAQVALYGQCGGQGYSQCLPGGSSGSTIKTTTTKAASTIKTTTTKVATTTVAPGTTTRRTTTTTVTTNSPNPTTNPSSGGSAAGVVGFATVGSGCSGGAGGSSVTVSSASALQAALSGDTPRIVYLNAAISNAGNLTIGSNKSLIGVGTSASLDKSSLSVRYGTKNVIIRNIKFTLCTGGDNDCITIKDPGTSNVWVDHCDFSGDMNANKDIYDGLIDVTREATLITISYNKFHNHHKALLFGSSSSAKEDVAIKVTVHHNYFTNIGSRTPSIRFGTTHVYNNFYDDVESCINVRDGSQNLIERNVFRNINKDVRADGGYCNLVDNDLGGGSVDCATGSFSKPPYSYTTDSTAAVLSNLIGSVGVGKI
ncbi:hypothetical protein HK097_008658 [Rhizophlyctis rosea]|uniref:Pectate lyase domain-containing protein n=1 Tax=Rhizophlyctis rosea TaxID=64517 RepID=A0AAD5X4C5_9FUNG|nr:hypothetical protein HK097_008658 [Rhizophlyctis rosea]